MFHCLSIEKNVPRTLYSLALQARQFQLTIQYKRPLSILFRRFFQFRHRLIYGFLPLLRRVSLLIPKKRVNAYSFYCGSIAYQLKKCPQDTLFSRLTARQFQHRFLCGRFHALVSPCFIAYQLKKCPQDTFSIAVTLHKKNAPFGASLFGRRREIAR